jgi:hypothetical protein
MQVEPVAGDIAAVVAFELSAKAVGELIEAFLESRIEPERWFVFSSDLDAMTMLDDVWQGTIDVVLCAIPSTSVAVMDAAIQVLHQEDVHLERCIWVQASSVGIGIPRVPGFVLTVKDGRSPDPKAVVRRVRDWLGGHAGAGS